MQDLVIFGTGGMAAVVSACIERHGTHRILGYTVDRAYVGDGTFRGRPVVPWEEIERHHPPGSALLLGPITYKRMNEVRRDRFREGLARGYAFASFLHPTAEIMTDRIGENVIVLAQTILEPDARLADNVIVWSQSHVGHHSEIGAHSYLSAQVVVAGTTRIGEQCHVSAQTGIKEGLTIGDRVAILHRASITRDIADDAVVSGPFGEVRRTTSARIRHLL